MISHKEKIQIITHNIMVGLINYKVCREDVKHWQRYKDEIIAEIESQLKSKCQE